ncbi:MAG: dUTP diphosphatase [Patescibacteria group bacterium]
MEVKIARIHPDAKIPEYKTSGAGCFDFAALVDTLVNPKEITKIRTGLVAQIPAGYFLAIAIRSSLPKLGLRMPNGLGVIDSDYCGPDDEIFILIENVTSTSIRIEKGQRIAQGYLVNSPIVSWQEISRNYLGKKSRGGFGSTGHK